MNTVERFWADGPARPSYHDGPRHPSLIVCASAYAGTSSLQRILLELNGCLGGEYAVHTPDDDAFNAGRPDEAAEFADYRRDGHLYFWRGARAMMQSIDAARVNLDDFRIAVAFRDPRDCVVSDYHNIAHGHPPPGEPALRARFEAEREATRREGLVGRITRFGIPWYRGIIATPVVALMQRVDPARVTFLSYAELCYDPPSYIDRLASCLGIDPPPALRARLLATEDVRHRERMVTGSNVHYKGASPLPGRFRSELQPDMIARLDAEFADVLDWMAAVDRPEFAALYARQMT